MIIIKPLVTKDDANIHNKRRGEPSDDRPSQIQEEARLNEKSEKGADCHQSGPQNNSLLDPQIW